MKKLLLITNIFLLFSCNATKTADSVTASSSINASAPYLWSSAAFPRNLKISDEFSDAEVTAIQEMTSAWETAVENKKNFFNDTERTSEISSASLNLDSLGSDGIFGIYKIKNWPMTLNSGALAITQIFGVRYNLGLPNEYVNIQHADILVNENLYNFRTVDAKNAYSFDFRTVILHEIGHFLGLPHKYGNTVMVPSITPSSDNRTPSSIDRTDLAGKYSVTLGTGTNTAIISGPRVQYTPNSGDTGQEVKILIELKSNGECDHYENGIKQGNHSL